MEFSFVGSCLSEETDAPLRVVWVVSDYLDIELSKRDYGAGVARVLMGISCTIWSNCPTGKIGHKKYTRSKRLLDLLFGLNDREVRASNSEQIVEILKRGVLATYAEVKAMGIKDFDVDAFYRDIGALLDERGWIKNPEKYRKPPFPCRRPSDRVARLRTHTDEQVDDQMDFLMGACGIGIDSKSVFVDQVTPISNYLAAELSRKRYGSGVHTIVMDVWCNGPGNEQLESSSDSYSSYSKRYYEYGRVLMWHITLDCTEVTSLDREHFVEILKRSIMRTADGVKALAIKDFDVDAFYRDVAALLDERGWIKNAEKYKIRNDLSADSSQRGAKSIPQRLRMPEADFWSLIQQSIDASEGDADRQLVYLEDNLAVKSEKEIVGFELTLRDLLRQSYHYNIVALLKAIDGSVTDDCLLYFRCRLILYGRDVFRTAVENPNKLTERLYNDEAGEHLLSVADRAFLSRYGENTDKDFPRDIGATYIDYNTDNYPERGRPWTRQSFAKRYAALLKLYEDGDVGLPG